jgi:predicted Co/Zn/Cd cation transporter (cation efflux family)
VNLRSQTERPRLFLLGTILLTVLAVYLLLDVVVEVSLGGGHTSKFWAVIFAFCLFVAWTTRRAIDRWKRVAMHVRGRRGGREPDSN